MHLVVTKPNGNEVGHDVRAISIIQGDVFADIGTETLLVRDDEWAHIEIYKGE